MERAYEELLINIFTLKFCHVYEIFHEEKTDVPINNFLTYVDSQIHPEHMLTILGTDFRLIFDRDSGALQYMSILEENCGLSSTSRSTLCILYGYT
jgi:hypothetical protein